jgi:signal transduction histidine kinase
VIEVPFLALGLLLVLTGLFGAGIRERRHGIVAAFLLSPLDPASWRAAAAIVAGFMLEGLAFSLATGAFSAGVSLLFIGVGVVILGVGIEGARLFAVIERWRAGIADPRPLRPHAYLPYGDGVGNLLRALFLDASRWRDVVYVFVAFPLAMLEFTAVVALWGGALGFLAAPFGGSITVVDGIAGWLAVAPSAVSAGFFVAGLILLPVAASASRGLMALHRAVVAGLLCDSEERRLERRVETLEGSRRAVLDVEASELRRVERDLHDGAQQRLVMLTIDLSLAAERIDTDPAGARALVEEAREQARQALADIRNLVRGVAPSILLDRGLVAALGAVAGSCPVPTTLQSSLPDGARLPDATERAAYFVATESLANVAKHSSATRCEVRVGMIGQRLVVEVADDGAGGARVLPDGGLAGLAGRVAALDGTLTVTSPRGGPTIVRAEIPPSAGAPAAAGRE